MVAPPIEATASERLSFLPSSFASCQFSSRVFLTLNPSLSVISKYTPHPFARKNCSAWSPDSTPIFSGAKLNPRRDSGPTKSRPQDVVRDRDICYRMQAQTWLTPGEREGGHSRATGVFHHAELAFLRRQPRTSMQELQANNRRT